MNVNESAAASTKDVGAAADNIKGTLSGAYDERQTIGLEEASEVYGDDSVELIVRDGVHQDGQGAVVLVAVKAE